MELSDDDESEDEDEDESEELDESEGTSLQFLSFSSSTQLSPPEEEGHTLSTFPFITCSHKINDKISPIDEAKNKLHISVLGPEGLVLNPMLTLCKSNDKKARVVSTRDTIVTLLDTQ
mmetsp:Transcript_24280/g.44644  ORF Transcript_24280/g.44644 Transcript_24280/m.44644 type:complete len:118 (+) Transcript_24280:1386-1739(+)